MLPFDIKAVFFRYFLIAATVCLFSVPASSAKDPSKEKGPPPSPVQVAIVKTKTVSNQISLVGTTDAIAESTVASEISGLVEHFPINPQDNREDSGRSVFVLGMPPHNYRDSTVRPLPAGWPASSIHPSFRVTICRPYFAHSGLCVT